MQATLTIKAVDQIIVDEATGQKWRIILDDEYKKLCRESEIGDTGDLAWFLSKVKMTAPTAKEKILYPFRDELENMVSYADVQGKPWKFHKTRVSAWLENNWSNYQ